MTNNLEDFEQPDLESGGDAPQARGMRANLANAWRTRPLFKLLILMTVVGAIIAASINLFSSKPAGDITKLAAPPPGFKAPAGGQASPYFLSQTEKAEKERVETAMKTGGSAMPTPIGENKSIDEMTDANKQQKDPLVELRSQIEHQKQQISQLKQQQQQPPPPPPANKPPEQFDESLAQAMQKQMQQLMSGWEPHGIKQVTVLKEEETAGDKKASAAGSANADASSASASAATTAPRTKIIVPAGTVSYAQLLTEANSDVPGPILAQIVSGPLSGARAVGEFKVSNDFLILKFSLANLKGKDYSIDALALDPDTTLGGMVTEVDHRYFTRVILPAAAGFIQGFGSALSQNGSSITLNGDTTIVQQSSKGLEEGLYQGLGQAGQTLGQFFTNEANKTKPLVRVAAGTPMGLFFVSSVNDRGTPPYPQIYQPGTPGYLSGVPGQPGAYSNAAQGAMSSAQNWNNTAENSVPYPNTAMPYTNSYGYGGYGGSGGYGYNYGGGYPGQNTYIGTPGITP